MEPAQAAEAVSRRVPEDWQGATVKRFAREYLGLSAKALAGQKTDGGILVNGQPARANTVLQPGDCLAFPLLPEEMNYPAVPLPVAVLYEDRDFLLIDKPPGMPVHPSPGHDQDSLLNAAAWHYRQTGQSHRVRPLYRLDKDTSGVLPLAKHRMAAGADLQKLYLAVCQGELSGRGAIRLPIGLREGSKIQRACGHGPGFQPACTHWQALGCQEGHTLLVLKLETGRTHQIRVHLAHMGHPLAGDDLYGGSLRRLSRQALHCAWLRMACRTLDFCHTFAAKPPQDLLHAFPWAREILDNARKGDADQYA